MVDGINGNYQNTSLSCVNNDKCEEIQEETTINFTEDVEENSNEDSVKITDKTESDKDVDKRNFDTEEAHIYAEGEAAIEKEVKQKVMFQMGLNSLLGGKSIEEIEAEVRAEYAAKHPEYAAVMEEGQAVEEAYNEAKTAALSEWEENNPKPEPPHPIFGSTVEMAAYSKKLQEWQAKRAEQEKAFSEEYAKDNTNYANLKEQQDKKPNIIDILTSPVIDPKIVMKDL